jgi:hypothetical protein
LGCWMSLHIFLGQWKVNTWDEIFKISCHKCKIPSININQ